MVQISEILQKKRSMFQEVTRKRPYFQISYKDYIDLMTANANIIMRNRNNNKFFRIDGESKYVIDNLYFYLTGNRNFYGNFLKGIFLIGPYGVGKTLILESFCQIINDLGRKQVKIVRATDLCNFFKEDKKIYESLIKIPLMIDDLGKEPKEVQVWGNIVEPAKKLIDDRYSSGSWTFATGNYKLTSYEKQYDSYISDRMKEMFNFYELTGPSQRE